MGSTRGTSPTRRAEAFRLRTITLLLVCCLLSLAVPLQCAIIRVKPSGNDTFNGSSWDLAKRTVGAALSAAVSGDEIWVAAGRYREHLYLVSGVQLYGGFAGNESDRAQRNWTSNVTTLGDFLDLFAHEPVVLSYDDDQTTVLDGFTIRGGKVLNQCLGIHIEFSSVTIANNFITGNGSDGPRGGGIYCYASSPVIRGNVIAANLGVGIGCFDSPAPVIANNTIVGNSGVDSVGIWLESSSPIVSNNIIAFNTIGIYASDASALLQNNCVYGNTDHDYLGAPGGTSDIAADPKLADSSFGNFHVQPDSPCRNSGLDSAVQTEWLDMDCQPRIQGTHVDIGADESDGTTWQPGAQIIVRVSPTGDDTNDGSDWTLAKRTLQSAIDAAAARGGEVWVRAGEYRPDYLYADEFFSLPAYCYMYGGFGGSETAREQRDWKANGTILDGKGEPGSVVGAHGGYLCSAIDGFTIRNGGEAIRLDSSSPRIANNSMEGQIGAGIYGWNSSPVITNNMIGGNGGPGIAVGGSPTIVNNTICGNAARSGHGAGIDCESSSGSPIIRNNIVAFNSSGIHWPSGSPLLSNNCVFGNTSYDYSGLAPGSGDILLDPLFVNASGEDYHITGASPCRNAGYNGAAGLPLRDMDGQGRIEGGTVDIGADEFFTPATSLASAKASPDLASIEIDGAIISAAFPDFFYVESVLRTTGIRVDKPDHSLAAGIKADIFGLSKTNGDGERYILASTAIQSPLPDNTGSVSLMALAGQAIGGGSMAHDPATGAGQRGVKMLQKVKLPDGAVVLTLKDMQGLNNIGLLIRAFGSVTAIDSTSFYLSDGSSDRLRVIVPTGVTLPAEGDYVSVTGISSCYRDESDFLRLLRVREQADISQI